MISTAEVAVTNRSGLHARPAAELARIVSKLSSTVTIRSDQKAVNAGSVLALMTARITEGMTVTVEAEGDDAEADLAKVVAAIESGLGE